MGVLLIVKCPKCRNEVFFLMLMSSYLSDKIKEQFALYSQQLLWDVTRVRVRTVSQLEITM